MTHHHLQQSDDYSFFFVLSHHHDHHHHHNLSLSPMNFHCRHAFQNAHPPYFLLLLHQMWWRLKGNSYARGLTKMNLMSRFLFDFFLFCFAVLSLAPPTAVDTPPLAVKTNKQTRNRNKQQATPLHTCVPRPLNLGTSNSLCLSFVGYKSLLRQFGPRLVTLSTSAPSYKATTSFPTWQRHDSKRLFFSSSSAPSKRQHTKTKTKIATHNEWEIKRSKWKKKKKCNSDTKTAQDATISPLCKKHVKHNVKKTKKKKRWRNNKVKHKHEFALCWSPW